MPDSRVPKASNLDDIDIRNLIRTVQELLRRVDRLEDRVMTLESKK